MKETMPDRYISRIEYLRERCRGRRVLHLGCSSGQFLQDRLKRNSLLHSILAEEAGELYGVDLDETSLETMRAMGFHRLYHGDAERLDDLDLEKTFDVVVAGDLLEHITRPGAMLDGVKRFLEEAGTSSSCRRTMPSACTINFGAGRGGIGSTLNMWHFSPPKR